jgi:hypothetical protein
MKKIQIGNKRLSLIDLKVLDKFLNNSGLFYNSELDPDYDLILTTTIESSKNHVDFGFKVIQKVDKEIMQYKASINWFDFSISFSSDLGSDTYYFSLRDINFLIKMGYYVPIQGYSSKTKEVGSKFKIHLDITELNRLIDLGMTIKDIALHFGCCSGVVSKTMKRYGIQRKHILDTLNFDANDLVEMYLSGKNQRFCKAHFGCSNNVARDILLAKGVKLTPGGKPHLPNLEMYYKKLGSMKACAEHYGLSIFTISKELLRLGVD